MSYTSLTLEVDADGIALITIDVPDQTMNVITPEFSKDLSAACKEITSRDDIKGAVITSGKPTGFIAGADLKGMDSLIGNGAEANENGPSRAAQVFSAVSQFNKDLRQLETCGKPIAAAINGLALGGGLELTLACHYRVVADNPKIKLGLPEVLVGLLPGGGGTQRVPRLIGIQAASMVLLQGKSLSPVEAQAMGLVHEVAPLAEIVDRAKAWVRDNPKAQQPWDKRGFKFPGGPASPLNPDFNQLFIGGNALVMKQTSGNMNAPKAIISCVYEGVLLPIDKALMVESKYFTKLLLDQQSHNMIRSLFVSKQAAEKGAHRPQGIEKVPTKKLAMLGAGMMGAGIAYVSARAGIEVILLDRDIESANKGKAYSEKLLGKAVSRGSMTKEKADTILALIKPTTSFDDLAGCDFVIEAVFEDRDIKADATQKTEAVLGADVVFGSNTSTLPITGLAKAWSKEDHFIGIHFFSPVDKMPLVEIILGAKTGDLALAKALDYVAQIRKTPIVVNDSRGFYTSRCFGSYVQEGYTMVSEGINPALIENCGRQIGMPVGPLAVADEVSIELGYKVMVQTRQDLGDAYIPSGGDAVVERMMKIGRLGRKAGKGFYDYPTDGSKKHIWLGLQDEFISKPDTEQPSAQEVKDRLIYRQLAECARCFEERVLTTPEDGDLGAIFGWGFAPFSGGPFSMMDSIGLEEVVRKLDDLAQKYGDGYAPTQMLRDMASRGEQFYSSKKADAA